MKSRSSAKLYNQLVETVKSIGYQIEPDPTAVTQGYHQIYKITKPEPIKGITFLDHTRIARLLRQDEIKDFRNEFIAKAGNDHRLIEFAMPLLYPS